MRTTDKPCYPIFNDIGIVTSSISQDLDKECFSGITFRERLIIALASNPNLIYRNSERWNESNNAIGILKQADAIIKEMEIEGRTKEREERISKKDS